MATFRLDEDELMLVREIARDQPLCCKDSPAQCPRCRLARGAFALALEVEALRAGLPQQPVAVLEASALTEMAVLARELAESLTQTPLTARSHAALTMLFDALADAGQ